MDSTKLFYKKADIYDKFRPPYATELYEYIRSNVITNCDNFTMADIGSGTGMFCEPFLRDGVSVYCVEPNESMRLLAEKKFREIPNFHSIDGDYAITGLKNQSVDIITVAQAFHYFDIDTFRTECKRILKKTNTVVIIWNRKCNNELEQERRKIAEQYCPLYLEYSKNKNFRDLMVKQFFEDTGNYSVLKFNNTIINNIDEFIGRTLSAYYAPSINDNNYSVYISALKDYFAKYSDGSRLVIPMETVAFIGTLAC